MYAAYIVNITIEELNNKCYMCYCLGLRRRLWNCIWTVRHLLSVTSWHVA